MLLSEQIIEYYAERATKNQPDRKARARSANELREIYAELKSHSKQRTLNAEQRSIYGVTRLAGTIAVMNEVLEMFLQKHPAAPKTILDCGSGPGTALFAAFDQFGDDISYTGIEKDAGFIAMAKNAVSQLLPHAAEHMRFVEGSVPLANFDEVFDLTIFSYMLSETPLSDLPKTLHWALEHTKHYLVITDAGTPAIYRQLMAARRIIIDAGWTVLAPCPHQHQCPMKAPDFCHFPTRFTRHEEARQLKGATRNAEDEKFCYLIAGAPRNEAQTPFAINRIVSRPLKRSGHCILDICTHAGTIDRLTMSKKHKERYRQARDASWGDEF